jgi:hypothetical protein
MTRLNPAHAILRKIIAHENGEPNYAAIAEELGLDRATVLRWTLARKPRGEFPRGTGGKIPVEYHDDLVTISQGRVTLADFHQPEFRR